MRLAAAAVLGCACPWALAQTDTAAPDAAPTTAPVAPAVVVPPAEPAAPAPAPTSARWEGAIGPVLSHAPRVAGSSQSLTKVTPGIFLRYGRFTVTNTSGFVTRRADDVARGLGLDLSTSERLRVQLALRADRGRQADSAPELAGLGDIRSTVRLRLTGTWRLDEHWRVGTSWSADALGRGAGYFGDLGVGYERRITASTVASAGVAFTAAGDRYMQNYFGVTPEQSAASGYPAFEARTGLRDLTGGVAWRTDLGTDWLLIGGVSATRLLGSAADSPITTSRNSWGSRLGLAWRF